MPTALTQITDSPEATRALAASWIGGLPEGPVVLALHGDLGAGKTCFVQGLAEALQVDSPVSSPTYTLIHEYGGVRPLIHVDLYRLSDAEEAQDAGLLELFEEDAVVAVEWPERALELFPPDTWHGWLEYLGGDQRRIRIARQGEEVVS